MTALPPVRPLERGDLPALVALLNEIIRIGGSTARETEVSEADLAAELLDGEGRISCVVALAPDGRPAGFQSTERHPELPPDWADIATFARRTDPVRGVGRALFAATRAQLAALGIAAINAAIRADNASGLAYYTRMGFETWRVVPAVPLADGRPVDRILKRYPLR